MIEWKVERRKLSELIPADWNPRTLSVKQKEDLENSLKKFGLAEIPAINTDNLILAGHQRIKVLTEIKGHNHEIDVRVPSRELTYDEVREYNVRSNKNSGSWDFDILANDFELGDLIDWGFEDKDFGLADEKFDIEDDEKMISDKMVLKLEYNDDEFNFVRSKLLELGSTPEQGLWNLLNSKK